MTDWGRSTTCERRTRVTRSVAGAPRRTHTLEEELPIHQGISFHFCAQRPSWRWLCCMRSPYLPGSDSLCSRSAERHRHWLEEETFPPAPLFVASRHAALQVHPTSYRPRATVVVMNHIAAAVRAAKRNFPTSTSQPRRSFQACTPRDYVTINGCTIQYKEVPNRSHPLSSKHPAPRPSANVAFAQVCAMRQVPSHECIHANANLLPLIILSFYGHLALCLGKSFSPKADKKRSMRLTFICVPRCSGLPPNGPGSLAISALVMLLRSVSPHALAFLRSALGRWRFGRWRSTGFVQPCRCSP